MLNKRYFFILLLLIWYNNLSAQDTVLTLNKIILPEKVKNLTYFISPIFAYNPETRLIFGAAAIIRLQQNQDSVETVFNRPSTLIPSIKYTLNDQFITTVEADLFIKKTININIHPRFAKYPDVFYGIGGHTQDKDKETYVDETFTLNCTVSGIFFKKEFLGLVVDVRNHELFNFEKARKLDSMFTTGTTGGVIAGAGLSFRHDTRDDIFYPTKGYYLHIQGVFFPKLTFNKYFFNNFLFDYRQVFTILNNRNIIAMQAFLHVTDGSNVPFYELQRIGGDDAMRGIHAKKYLGKNAFLVQAEYRRFLFWRFNVAIFTGVGGVSNTLKSIMIDDLKINYGIGLRYKILKDEKINLRFDAGFGPDHQIGFYIEAKESF